MKELSLNILDLAQNSITAGASLVKIEVIEDPSLKTLTVRISDNGCGMSAGLLASVTDPFTTTRTTRKAGLGIPLFKMAMEQTGGFFQIESEPGVGTAVTGVMRMSHLDSVPLGDMAGTMMALIQGSPGLDFLYRRAIDSTEFLLDTAELRDTLGDVSLGEPDVLSWVVGFINENENELKG